MSRLFGTDGVRGLANGPVITAELALSVSVAAARVLGEVGRRPGPPAQGGRGARPARLGRVPRRGRRGRARLGRRRRLRRRRAADAGGRLPHRRHRRRLRRHALGVAQPDARQRHQVLRPRRAQAARRGRGPRSRPRWASSGPRPTGADVGRVVTMPDGHTRYISHLLRVLPQPARRAAGRHRRRPRRREPWSRPRSFRLAGAEVVEIGTAPDGLNINDGYGSTHLDPLKAAVRRARRRPRHRPRRRRRPLPGGRRHRHRGRRRPDHGHPRRRAARSAARSRTTPSSPRS